MGDFADDAIDRLMGCDFEGDHGFFSRRRNDDGPREPRCEFCGATDVRWRQQTGKWVLFSLTPGVEHACPGVTDDSGFDIVPD